MLKPVTTTAAAGTKRCSTAPETKPEAERDTNTFFLSAFQSSLPSHQCLPLTESNQKQDSKEVWKNSLQSSTPSDTEKQGQLHDHLSVQLLSAPFLEEPHAVTLLKLKKNFFCTKGPAFFICVHPANYGFGSAEESMEGQIWNWEQRGKCQDCYGLPIELSKVKSCLDNYKLVTVLIGKFLRFPLSSL